MFRNVTDPSLISTGSTPVTLKKQEPLPFKLLSSIYHPPPSSIIVSSVSSKSGRGEREFDANCMELLLFFCCCCWDDAVSRSCIRRIGSNRIEEEAKTAKKKRRGHQDKIPSCLLALLFRPLGYSRHSHHEFIARPPPCPCAP